MIEPKYELLTDCPIEINGHPVYRIKALRDFGLVKKGDLGGYIESERNLGHLGLCWVYDNAVVYGDAQVYGDAGIHNKAKVYGHACILEHVNICDESEVYGRAIVSGYVKVKDASKIFDVAKVQGCSLICMNSTVCHAATVGGDAIIYASRILNHANVYGNARVIHATVCDNAVVSHETQICKGGYITKTTDYITLGPITIDNNYFTFYLNEKREIIVKANIYEGPIEKLERKFDTANDDSEYKRLYMSTINYVKQKLLGGK